MLQLQRRDRPEPALAPELAALVERVTDSDGDAPLSEGKRMQLTDGGEASGRWSGVLAYAGGELIGYAHLRWNAAAATPRAAVELVLDPGYRDQELELRLLAEARSAVAVAGGGTLHAWAYRVTEPSQTAPARAGFALQRRLACMCRPLSETPAAPAPPGGMQLTAYRPGAGDPQEAGSAGDDAELLRVNNAAFAGHPENGGWGEPELAALRAREWFDPEGVICAWWGGKLAGFHWTKIHRDVAGGPGEVYVLAVDPDAQGHGLGRVLLEAGLAHLAHRGCKEAILYVDRANTGAVALYESAGFAVATEAVCYASVVQPGAGSDGSAHRPGPSGSSL
jgi:mycothiol synthase